MMLLSSVGFLNFGINDSFSILIIANTHFLILYLKCKDIVTEITTLVVVVTVVVVLFVMYRNVVKHEAFKKNFFVGSIHLRRKRTWTCVFMYNTVLMCYTSWYATFSCPVNSSRS